jgi:hypothetical protein
MLTSKASATSESTEESEDSEERFDSLDFLSFESLWRRPEVEVGVAVASVADGVETGAV